MPKASRRDATGNSSESVRVTRSCRSSPILPIKQEIMQEKLVLNEQENVERPVQRNYYMEAANVINDSVQLTTIQEQLTSLRNIVVQEVSFNATRDKRLTMIEEKLDKVLSYFPLSIKNNMYEPIPDQPSEGSSDSFVPGGKHYNKMATWIRVSIGNLKVEGLEWDLTKSFSEEENLMVTKHIINFVGLQITALTNRRWTEMIPYIELQRKIRCVFRRKIEIYRTSLKGIPVDNRKSTRKGRRTTKCKHRRNVMAHEEYGQKMKDIYGNDVENLLIEQLQSDEESTDSEMGITERDGRLRIIIPDWRTCQARQAFRHFDKFDLLLRKHALKEKDSKVVGRKKHVAVKPQFLEKAPDWARVSE